MSSLHICFVESGYPHPHGGGGGAGTRIQLISRELIRRGHKVSVVTKSCPLCPRVGRDEGVKVYRPSCRSPYHWYISKVPVLRQVALATRYLERGWHQYRFLNHLNAKDPIDIVEFTEGGDFWHAWRSSFPYVVFLSGSSYTFLHQAGYKIQRQNWYQRFLELQFIRRSQHIIAPSQAMVDIVTEEAKQVFECLTILPNPLDPRLLRRSANKVSDGVNKIVLFAARNDPVKGADVLLEAVPQVRRAVPEVRFWMFGYQPDEGTKIPEGVRCFDFVPKEELLQYYHQADLCVIPSRWDNSPNTVYEAMAAGKAVVASRVGGIPELVKDGETGVLVEPADSHKLARALIRLLTDDTRLSQMGQRGYERIKGMSDCSGHVNRRLDLYRQIINSRESK